MILIILSLDDSQKSVHSEGSFCGSTEQRSDVEAPPCIEQHSGPASISIHCPQTTIPNKPYICIEVQHYNSYKYPIFVETCALLLCPISLFFFLFLFFARGGRSRKNPTCALAIYLSKLARCSGEKP